MRLQEVTIKNFRGYKNETIFPIDECLTAFIGKNDSGKSTILEAIGVFLNSDSVKLDKDDFNKYDENCLIEITGKFDNFPEEVIIDETNPTSLSAEYLLNLDSVLEIKKYYKRTSLTNPKVSIIAIHPTTEGYSDVHKLDLKNLKKRADELKLDKALVEDERKSAHWRKAIWESCPDLNLKLSELDISEFAGDSKKLQEKIQNLLPLYQLFKVDRETKDDDPVAKSPLQDAVSLAKQEFAERISELENDIKNRVIERANATKDKLKEMDETLADSLTPRFKSPPKWTFDFSIDDDNNIPINKRGSGVRRLILLNFFRAEAERKIETSSAPSVIYAFEEPETSQHPNYQEMLVEAFLELGRKENCQVLLTTHVPALGAMLPVSGLRLIKKSGSGSEVFFGSDDIVKQIADTLGVLPDPFPRGAKALLLVEGPSDIIFLNHTAQVLKDNGHISATFLEKKIALIIIGGCGTLKHWRTKRIAEQFEVPYGVFLDSDISNPVNSRVNAQHIVEIRADGHKAHLTKKNEIENYLDESILGLPAGTVNITDISDAKKDIARALRIKDTEVIERFYPLMTHDLIRQRERYVDGGVEKYELTEIISDFLELANE